MDSTVLKLISRDTARKSRILVGIFALYSVPDRDKSLFSCQMTLPVSASRKIIQLLNKEDCAFIRNSVIETNISNDIAICQWILHLESVLYLFGAFSSRFLRCTHCDWWALTAVCQPKQISRCWFVSFNQIWRFQWRPTKCVWNKFTHGPQIVRCFLQTNEFLLAQLVLYCRNCMDSARLLCCVFIHWSLLMSFDIWIERPLRQFLPATTTAMKAIWTFESTVFHNSKLKIYQNTPRQTYYY